MTQRDTEHRFLSRALLFVITIVHRQGSSSWSQRENVSTERVRQPTAIGGRLRNTLRFVCWTFAIVSRNSSRFLTTPTLIDARRPNTARFESKHAASQKLPQDDDAPLIPQPAPFPGTFQQVAKKTPSLEQIRVILEGCVYRGKGEEAYTDRERLEKCSLAELQVRRLSFFQHFANLLVRGRVSTHKSSAPS